MTAVLVFVLALAFLPWMLRRSGCSLGLPFAYLAQLGLIHVPGAVVHLLSGGIETSTSSSTITSAGMELAAIGAASFVAGAWCVNRGRAVKSGPFPDPSSFAYFCLAGGWLFLFGLSLLGDIPGVAALSRSGGAIWMLGAMLALRAAFERKSFARVFGWSAVVVLYPVLGLVLSGFLSYGSASLILVGSALIMSARSYLRVAMAVSAATFVGLNVFLNYFLNRDMIRAVVWTGQSLHDRLEVVGLAFADFTWFDPNNMVHVAAFDDRLNQNYFVGLAATRVETGQQDLLYGYSLLEGLMALVPRAIWPDKPVFGGSGTLVRDFTGLNLSETTAWGVGNILEFYMNFGTFGLGAGCCLLGMLIGKLDYKVAEAARSRDYARALVFFLPCVGLIRPADSMVEIFGGAGAGLVAAHLWIFAWERFRARTAVRVMAPSRASSVAASQACDRAATQAHSGVVPNGNVGPRSQF